MNGYGEAGEAKLKRTEAKQFVAKTIWMRGRHTAGGSGGSNMLLNALGKRDVFSFPKSVYATKDCLEAAIGNRPEALILVFFAGSGTTLNSVNLLNASANGSRRCILVTNNELSGEDAELLKLRGLQPGDDNWEVEGICRSGTVRRCGRRGLARGTVGSRPDHRCLYRHSRQEAL